MTENTSPQPFDFQGVRRLAPRVQHSLQRWQTDACTLVTEAWSALATCPLTVAFGAATPQRTPVALGAVADPATGVVLRLGPAKLPALLVLDPALRQAIFADLLGSAEAGTPGVEMTPLEDSLLDALLTKLCSALADAWPGAAPLACAIHELTRPRRTRRLAPYEEVIAVSWRFTCRFHTGDAHWLIPRRELEALLDDVQTPQEAAPLSPEEFGELIEHFPLELTVQIGQATLSTSAMTRLGVGDVLLLDQPVDKPLTACVNARPQWLVRPCRVGQRQAVAIDSLLDN